MPTLIIDGNNLASALRKGGLSDGLDEELLQFLRSWLGGLQHRGRRLPHIHLFLDAGASGAISGRLGGVTVTVAPHGVTADTLILAELSRRRSRPGEVIVVTSDRDLAQRARALGAGIRASPEFVAELQAEAPPTELEKAVSAAERRKLEAAFGVGEAPAKATARRRLRRASEISELVDQRRLLTLATGGPHWARRRAVRALAAVPGFDVGRSLKALLSHAVPGVRAAAVQALASRDDPGTASILEPLLGDPSPLVRAAVASAAQALSEPDARSLLDKLEQDGSRRVRRAARARDVSR